MLKNSPHTTVLLEEAVNSIKIIGKGIYIDATFGRGGHSLFILSKLGAQGRLLAMDRDPKSIHFYKYITDLRFSLLHGHFSDFTYYVIHYEMQGNINGFLLDLGVSSPQFDEENRGFSFMQNGPLDMRMDPTRGKSAEQWLRKSKKEEIYLVLKNFGEERFAKRIARAMITRNNITHTKELSDLMVHVHPLSDRCKHPATRSFQAIRIYINSELEEMERVLEVALSVLAHKGRLVVISFHSLEDRIVKIFMRHPIRGTIVSTTEFVCDRELKKRKKILPLELEVQKNPRARSSVLRIAERRFI